MINHLVNKFKGLERDINALSYALLFFIVLLSARLIVLLYQQEYKDLWTILRPIVSSFAALLVTKTATRLIINNNLIRQDDRRKDLVRVTHHLLAIVNDLRSRVHYFKTMLNSGNRPVLVLGELASSIEHRYETLLERDAYQYLPGPTVDLIVSMSGTVFGLTTLARGLERASKDKALASIDSILPSDRDQQISSLDRLSNDLEKLLDHIYELRASIDHKED